MMVSQHHLRVLHQVHIGKTDIYLLFLLAYCLEYMWISGQNPVCKHTQSIHLLWLLFCRRFHVRSNHCNYPLPKGVNNSVYSLGSWPALVTTLYTHTHLPTQDTNRYNLPYCSVCHITSTINFHYQLSTLFP